MAESFISYLVTGGVGLAGVAFLLKLWIDARLRSALQREAEIKKKVELVAEILGIWLAYEPGAPIPQEHRTSMNKLLFAATLWLPTPLVAELTKLLTHQGNQEDLFRILLLARRELIADTSLSSEQLAYFPAETERSDYPLPQKESLQA